MHHDIKIGTMVGGYGAQDLINKIKHHGFETFALNFWQTAKNENGEITFHAERMT